MPEYKNIAAAALELVATGRLPRGRKWAPVDVVCVLAYAWLRGVSVHHAAEKLNHWAVVHGFHVPETFADGRQSRAVPHQTTVNEWLGSLDLATAHALAGAVFAASLKHARKRGLLPRQVTLQFDLTYLGYWGRRRDPLIKGSRTVKGTRFMRHYHAALVHGGGVSMFAALQHVAKGQSKVPFMLQVARRLKGLGFKVRWVLVDREYYRHGVLAGLKGLGHDVVTPAKNYVQLQQAKEAYLQGQKGRVQRYRVGTKNKKGRRTRHLACWVVVYPRGTQTLGAIRGAFRRGKKTLAEAATQLYGLITTAAPQGHGRKYPRTLRRLYKSRWQIETGFRDENVKHCPWRSDADGTRLVDVVGRLLLFNEWQLARKEDPRGRDLTFQAFRDERVSRVAGQLNL